MRVLLVGLNHRTAPVAVRERFAVSRDRALGLTEKIVRSPEIREAAILSTCNRTEIVGIAPDVDSGIDRAVRFLRHEVGEGPLEARHLYRLQERDAISHVLRVASSLDSMVLGEAQILGQVKEAYRTALESSACGPVLNRLFQHAFRAAKRVRTETGLGASSVSVARIGVQLARELFESFEGKRVLLVGAGQMAESALLGLCEAGVRDVVIANRTLESAQRLTERLGGVAAPLERLEEELLRADVLLASVDVSQPLLSRASIAGILGDRHGRPLLGIDLGLPRNVDPDANDLPNVYVYDLDDLQDLAERGMARRRDAVAAAEEILSQEFERFDAWRATLPLVPTIQSLIEGAERQALEEARRAADSLPDPGGDARLERLAELVARKILHRPLSRLRAAAADGTGDYYAEALRHLFALDEEEE